MTYPERRLRGGNQYLEETARALKWISQALPVSHERDVFEEAAQVLLDELESRERLKQGSR